MTACMLRVNRVVHELELAGSETLLTVLRDRLHLLGAKCGCNQGVCGACTVMIDGRAVRSCLSLAADCQDADITTIEGLGNDDIGVRLQQAFVAVGAIQCGFCTPGMIVAARSLLAENPKPSIDDVRRGLSGNLCRCSGYRKVVEAVRQACQAGSP